MSVKILTLFCLILCMVTAQGQVSISGTVQDSRSKAAVAGAKVSLLGFDLTANTDAAGKFAIAGTSILQPRDGRHAPSVAGSSSLTYRHHGNGTIRISIADLSGRQLSTIFDGQLATGLWRITPPTLAPGLYLCTFETHEGLSTLRFLSSGRTSGANGGALSILNDNSETSLVGGLTKQKAAAPIDSLKIEKNGFRTAFAPLTSYQQTGINVLIEDTASSVNANDAAIIPDPSWTCYMPDGIPPPKVGTKVFAITLQYSAVHNVGLTKFGERRQFDIKGGTIKGDKIDGTVLTGGLDYELTLSNGSMEIEQIIILKAGNTHMLMRNAGVAPSGDKVARVVLDFEAPNSSSYTWLHTGKFAANRVIDSTAKTIQLDVYDISSAVLPATRVQIKDPADAANQTWECLKWSGSQGATVFTENCLLGSTINLGASKRGSRNIMLITGGTTTGKVKGKILAGGADFQLSGGIDARYTLAPDDGEFIIIRNCGSGQLIPVFEARVAGPYNFLNENKYLSSPPGVGSGGVSITFYEKK